jgi:hypothetical protein
MLSTDNLCGCSAGELDDEITAIWCDENIGAERESAVSFLLSLIGDLAGSGPGVERTSGGGIAGTSGAAGGRINCCRLALSGWPGRGSVSVGSETVGQCVPTNVPTTRELPGSGCFRPLPSWPR